MRLLFLLGGIIFLFLGDISSGQKYFPVSQDYERQGGNDYGKQGDNDYGSQGDNDYGLSNTDSDYGRQGDNDYGSQGNDDYVRIIYDDYGRQGDNDYGLSNTESDYGRQGDNDYGSQLDDDYGLSYTESDYGSQGDDDYARRNRKCRKTDTKRNCLNLMIHQCTQRCEKKTDSIKGLKSLLQSLDLSDSVSKKKRIIRESVGTVCYDICAGDIQAPYVR